MRLVVSVISDSLYLLLHLWSQYGKPLWGETCPEVAEEFSKWLPGGGTAAPSARGERVDPSPSGGPLEGMSWPPGTR